MKLHEQVVDVTIVFYSFDNLLAFPGTGADLADLDDTSMARLVRLLEEHKEASD